MSPFIIITLATRIIILPKITQLTRITYITTYKYRSINIISRVAFIAYKVYLIKIPKKNDIALKFDIFKFMEMYTVYTIL